jgi:pimeloyl-ACP methyl ester carboxylesterase
VASCTTDRTRRAYLRANAEHLDPPARHVIVIPGFGVTRLFDPVKQRYVWGTARATVRTRFEDDLDLPPGGVRDRLVPRGYTGSRGPINTGWQLTEALRKFGGYTPGATVHPFHYDWRLSARDNAEALSAVVDTISPEQRVDLVTHSAGAMVALAYLKLGNGSGRVENLVMIAPPQRGVVDAFRVFVRPERFIRRTFSPEVVATWPSVYELLPEDGRFLVDENGGSMDFDAWEAGDWTRVGVHPDETLIERARRFRDELRSIPMPPGVRSVVIAGDCVPTTRRALQRSDGSFAFYPDELRDDQADLRPILFEAGDGTVPVSSAAGGPETQLFCDGHQGIATDPNVHRAILRVLGGDK